MDILVFFAAMALFFLVILIREAYMAKKREKAFIASLYNDYGRIPEKEYSLDRFVRIASYYNKHGTEDRIDDITWNDLNMDEIFKRMNYTFSASGEEYLYYTLRNGGKSIEELEHFEEVIHFFEGHPDERVKIQYLMSRLGHTGKFSLYDYIDNLDNLGKRSNRKHIFLNAVFVLLLVLLFIKPLFSYALVGIVGLICYNIFSYFKEKNEIEPYIISFSYVMRLKQICEKVRKVNVPVCEEEWEAIRKHCGKLRGMKRGSYIVFTSGQGISSGNIVDIFLDYVRMVFHLDIILFNRMLAQLRLYIEDVDALIAQIGYVETAIAVGAFRKSVPGFCVPQLEKDDSAYADTKSIILADAYHPLIENAVRNSITTQKGVLLTGSNASGKSTFLKTVAINAILAQTIHTCTAGAYKAPLYRIYSSMSLRDDLESGESYYIVEIKALKRILDAEKQKKGMVLCFVDEVLRGTNTVERIAASTQILKSLSDSNILCFAATHDIELTTLLENDFENFHFEEDIREGDVFFNYKLLPGKATTRNAIRLLEIMGYRQDIIGNATKMAEEFLRTGKWN